MAAPLKALDDTSELDGQSIAVAPRIGWLLRASRLCAPGFQGTTQSALRRLWADRGLKVSSAFLSEVESGRALSYRLIRAYEAGLELAPGQLAAPISIMCRTFPNSPIDGAHTDRELTVEMVSARSLVVAQDRMCSGGEWLAWAGMLARRESLGVPLWLVDGWLDRLVSELARSIGTSYATRYEAVCLLRSGPYGGAVLRAARRALSDPGVQVVFDLMSAVSEYPDSDLLAWACELLHDRRPHVVRGACLALENAVVGGRIPDTEWQSMEAEFIAAYNDSVGQPEIHDAVSAMLVALRPTSRRRISPHLRGTLVKPARLAHHGPKHANLHWATSAVLSRQISQNLGLGDVNVLTRLVLEMLFDHRETRSVTSAFLLGGLPRPDAVFRPIFEYAVSESGPVREMILERIATAQSGVHLGHDCDFPRAESVTEQIVSATLLAQAGARVPMPLLESLISQGGLARRRALYAAGLTTDPWLATLTQDLHRPLDVRRAADWWLRQGGRISDTSPTHA